MKVIEDKRISMYNCSLMPKVENFKSVTGSGHLKSPRSGVQSWRVSAIKSGDIQHPASRSSPQSKQQAGRSEAESDHIKRIKMKIYQQQQQDGCRERLCERFYCMIFSFPHPRREEGGH